MVPTGVRPDLRVTDRAEETGSEGETWTVRVLAERSADLGLSGS